MNATLPNACRDLTRYTSCKFIHIMCSADSVRAERDKGLEMGVAIIQHNKPWRRGTGYPALGGVFGTKL